MLYTQHMNVFFFVLLDCVTVLTVSVAWRSKDTFMSPYFDDRKNTGAYIISCQVLEIYFRELVCQFCTESGKSLILDDMIIHFLRLY